MVSYIPDGHNHVSPYLVVENVDSLVEFINKTFNAQELFRDVDKETGRITHVELKIADTVIMIGESTKYFPAMKTHLHVYTKNADDIYKKALENGAEILSEIGNKDDGDRRGSVHGPEGIDWTIATKIS